MTSVVVVTSSRADWITRAARLPRFMIIQIGTHLVATAAMVDHDYGSAIAEVEAEGYEVPHRIPCLRRPRCGHGGFGRAGPTGFCAVLCGTAARRRFGHGRSF